MFVFYNIKLLTFLVHNYKLIIKFILLDIEKITSILLQDYFLKILLGT